MIGYNINTSPISFLAILELKLEMEINRHGTMTITGYINEEDEETCLKTLSGEVWEKVEEVGKDGDKSVLFWGVVSGFFIERLNDQSRLTLEIMTGSSLMDEEKHLRSYQDTSIKYKQIYQQTNESYADNGIIFSSPLQEKVENLILQYDETDWAFLKRLASGQHQFLVPEAEEKGTKFFYGLPKGREFPFPENIKYSVGKNLSEYRNKKYGGLPQAAETDYLFYRLHQCREKHGIGDYATVEGRKFCVCRIQGSYAGGEMLFDYLLKQEGGLETAETWQKDMAGCSLDAVVTEVKEDKVKVEILEDENKDCKKEIWYPYATVYSTEDGTGWYCMPEPGDAVRLTVPGKKESEAFVTSSVHMETDSEDRKNPEVKILKNKHQKEVRFTSDSIILTNNQGTRIELTDSEGIHIISAHSVILEAAEDMTISSGSGSLLVAGASSVNLQQNKTSICLDSGISFTGGEMRVQ